jgi:integrase
LNIYPEAFNEFVTRSGCVRTPATEASFNTMIRQFARQVGTPVEKVTTAELTTYCLGRRKDGEPSAPATIRLKKALMQSFFSWLEYAQLTPTNPASQLKFTVRPGHGNAKQGRWLTEKEVGELIRSCGDDDRGRRNRLILMIGFFTGLRRSEIANLRWEHFNAAYTQVQVYGKGNKWATVGLPAQLTEEIRVWRSLAPAGSAFLPALFALNAWRTEARDTYVNWAVPLGDRGLAEAVMRCGDRAGIELRPHDMRRTFAGLLEDKGVQIKDIARAMRHSNVGTTDRYLDNNPSRAVAVTSGFTLNLGG